MMPFTLPLYAHAPDFNLLGTDHKYYRLNDFKDFRFLVIFFTCNHCPYVKGSDEITRQSALHFAKDGVQFIAINSNSPNTYKEDSFEHMVQRMKEHRFPWVYLHDKTQDIARSYGALRTPHFFVFDENRRLRYCGRAVDNPRNSTHVHTHELDIALQELIANQPVTIPLTNPIGCNIKWEGKDAHWMPPEACDLV